MTPGKKAKHQPYGATPWSALACLPLALLVSLKLFFISGIGKQKSEHGQERQATDEGQVAFSMRCANRKSTTEPASRHPHRTAAPVKPDLSAKVEPANLHILDK